MTPSDRRLIACTEVEIEVLTELVRDGAENHLIGSRIYRSEHTIKTHIKRLTARMQARNRTDLALKIARKQIVVVTKGGRVHEF